MSCPLQFPTCCFSEPNPQPYCSQPAPQPYCSQPAPQPYCSPPPCYSQQPFWQSCCKPMCQTPASPTPSPPTSAPSPAPSPSPAPAPQAPAPAPTPPPICVNGICFPDVPTVPNPNP